MDTVLSIVTIFDSKNVFRNRVLDINDDTGLNTIVLAPSNFNSFNTFGRIIFLDPVLNMGYISALHKQTKSTIYLPKMVDGVSTILKDISLERDVFGVYFRLMQFAFENKITGYFCYNLYKNIIQKIKDKTKTNYLQFFVCLQVFKELGIVQTNEDDTEIIKINNEKNPLNASAFYNRLSTLKCQK